MGGTVSGGIIAAETNKEKHGKDFYRRIGQKGGKVKNSNKGFGSNRERAKEAGRIGGTISRRTKKTEDACVCNKPDKYGFVHLCWLHHDCSDGSCTHQDGEE